MVKLLLDFGAIPEGNEDNRRSNPLQVAFQNGHEGIFRALDEAGSPYCLVPADFYDAARRGHSELVMEALKRLEGDSLYSECLEKTFEGAIKFGDERLAFFAYHKRLQGKISHLTTYTCCKV